MLLHFYYYSGCQSCSMQKQCTTGKERRVKRWEHEAVIDAMQVRLEHDPGKMKVRRQTVEHPFGTLKYWMGATHFLTKTLPRVSTEMSRLCKLTNVIRASARLFHRQSSRLSVFDVFSAFSHSLVPRRTFFVSKRSPTQAPSLALHLRTSSPGRICQGSVQADEPSSAPAGHRSFPRDAPGQSHHRLD